MTRGKMGPAQAFFSRNPWPGNPFAGFRREPRLETPLPASSSLVSIQWLGYNREMSPKVPNWEIAETPRLVTAYPIRERKR